MARPNYQFEKRQRDLAKKKKREEKAAKKQAARGRPDRDEGASPPTEGAAPGAPPAE